MRGPRLLATIVVTGVVLALSACGGDPDDAPAALEPAATASRPVSSVRVGVAYSDPSVQGSASQSADVALKRAETDFGVRSAALAADPAESDKVKEDRLTQLAEDGYNPVIAVGRSYSYPLSKVAEDFPRTRFAIVDGPVSSQKNVTQLLFDENQGTFLAGTVAAQASETGKVAFVGGYRVPALDAFANGFEQGAKAVKPKIKVAVEYLSTDGSGFQDPGRAKAVAKGLIKDGNDVIFTASLDSNPGVFDAAAGAKALAIGMETDQYAAAEPGQQPAILTSVVKNTDAVVYAMIRSAVDGDMLTGARTFGVKAGAISLATSNPKVQPYEATAQDYAARLAAGTIKLKP